MGYDWDAHHHTCYRLYIQEGRSLDDIMDHMRAVYRFAPSKRAFQTQFRRWDFPPKQRPAHRNEKLVRRVKELWERNLPQREMLRVLNDEDGFDIKPWQLARARKRNRLLLRAANGEKAAGRAAADPGPGGGDDASLSDEPAAGRDGQSAASDGHGSDCSTSSPPGGGGGGGDDDDAEPKRTRARGGPGAAPARFPSETTLQEARKLLRLDPPTYQLLRANCQRICLGEGVSKKTLAGTERWEAIKARLVGETPQLQAMACVDGGGPESMKLALDVICTDVTKRMRSLGTRMTLAQAKTLLRVNPAEAREARASLHQVLSESNIWCKSEATPEQWEAVKRAWGQRSDAVRRIADAAGARGAREAEQTARALEVVARDVMKRIRDDRGPRGRGGGGPRRAGSTTARAGSDEVHDAASAPADVHLGDGLGALDAMSEVSHASQMALGPASSSAMGVGLPLPLPLSLSLSLPLPLPLPLLEGGDGSAGGGFMEQPQQQHHDYAGAAGGAPAAEASTACAAYLRLHPSSGLAGGAGAGGLWIATLGSHSVDELRRTAAGRVPGSVCVGVEGVLRDAKGRELLLRIERDEELAAYLAHLQGAAPTLCVQLVEDAR